MPEEMFELVPVDPLSKVSRQNERLEREIHDIRSALRGTAGISKIESNASTFIDNVMSLMKSSQKMVEEVAKSNSEVAKKIETALENMEKSNADLSDKLTKILTFFAKATEAMEGEQTTESQVVTAVNSLNDALVKLSDATIKNTDLLASIERNVKQQRVRSQALPMPPPRPQMRPMGDEDMPPMPPSAPPRPKGFDLPPPPFPPQ